MIILFVFSTNSKMEFIPLDHIFLFLMYIINSWFEYWVKLWIEGIEINLNLLCLFYSNPGTLFILEIYLYSIAYV